MWARQSDQEDLCGGGGSMLVLKAECLECKKGRIGFLGGGGPWVADGSVEWRVSVQSVGWLEQVGCYGLVGARFGKQGRDWQTSRGV